MNVLTELEVKSLTTPGRYSDGNSLYLKVSESNRKSWLCRYRVEGKQREAGLGSYPFVSLKEARKKNEPPHLNWSTTMFRKRRTENGEQATEAGRDCLEVKAS